MRRDRPFSPTSPVMEGAVMEQNNSASVPDQAASPSDLSPFGSSQSGIPRAQVIITTSDITRQLAGWAVAQSPYPVPDNLELVLRRFQELWPCDEDWTKDFCPMKQWASQDEVYAALWVAFEQIPELLAWNEPKSRHGSASIFVSRYEKPSPDDDIIDLHALAGNVSREAWRENIEFDEQYDASAIEARSDETPQAAQPEGRERDPKGDAQGSPA